MTKLLDEIHGNTYPSALVHIISLGSSGFDRVPATEKEFHMLAIILSLSSIPWKSMNKIMQQH